MTRSTILQISIGAVGMAVLAGLLVLIPGLVEQADQHEGMAAWVQAVFSVAAIIASSLIAIRIDQGSARRAREAVEVETTMARAQAVRLAQRTIDRLECVRVALGSSEDNTTKSASKFEGYFRELEAVSDALDVVVQRAPGIVALETNEQLSGPIKRILQFTDIAEFGGMRYLTSDRILRATIELIMPKISAYYCISPKPEHPD